MMNRSVLRAAVRSVQAGRSVAGRRYASSAVFNWEDPLAAEELYTPEELAIQDTARQYCQDRLMPRVLGTKMLSTVYIWMQANRLSLQRPTATKTLTVGSSKKWASWACSVPQSRDMNAPA